MIRKKPCNSTKKALLGMTLIELLVAVAIIGVLTAVVYPNYTKHVIAAHRATAKADLIKLQLYLEQHYNASSTNSAFKGGYDHGVITATTCVTSKVRCDSETDRYDFNIKSLVEGTDPSGYVLTAKAKGVQEQSGSLCNSITLKSNGQSSPSECW